MVTAKKGLLTNNGKWRKDDPYGIWTARKRENIRSPVEVSYH